MAKKKGDFSQTTRIKVHHFSQVEGAAYVYSPGYFAQLGQWQFVVIFVILFVSALVSLINVARFREA